MGRWTLANGAAVSAKSSWTDKPMNFFWVGRVSGWGGLIWFVLLGIGVRIQ